MVYGYYTKPTSQTKTTDKRITRKRARITHLDKSVKWKKDWNELINCLKPGDTVIVDSIFDIVPKILFCEIKAKYKHEQKKKDDKFEMTEEELAKARAMFEPLYEDRTKVAYDEYKKLYLQNINLKFCWEPYLNSDVFRLINDEDALTIIKKQIELIYLEDAPISAGLEKKKKKEPIGRIEGNKYETKKSKAAKKIIKANSADFEGDKTDPALIDELKISRNTYYKYKKELLYGEIAGFRGDYAFLSNYYDKNNFEMIYKGIKYHSSEAAYQAQKAPTFEERMQFSFMQPDDAKEEGKKYKQEGWENRSLQIMKDILRVKFTESNQAEFLRDQLCATGNRMISEKNSWHDNFWGWCSCAACKEEKKENWLGKLLMELRDELNNE